MRNVSSLKSCAEKARNGEGYIVRRRGHSVYINKKNRRENSRA